MRGSGTYSFALAAAIFVSALLILLPSPSIADENQDWTEAYAQWQKDSAKKVQTDAEKCQAMWDFFWPWAKRGNIQARAAFYVFMTLPRRYRLNFPTSSSDFASLMRDAMIFQVHSAGIQYDETADEDIRSEYSGMAEFYEKQISFWDGLNGGSYLACIKKANSRDTAQMCAKTAVQEGLVPSFEDYAKEIDFLIAQGLRPLCVDGRAGRQSKPPIIK